MEVQSHRKKKIEITVLSPYVNPLALPNQLIDFSIFCKNVLYYIK